MNDSGWTEKIKTILEKRNWSLRQLAADINMSPTYLSDVVRGVRPASLSLRVAILSRLGREVDFNFLMDILPDDIREQVRKLPLKHGQTEN